jgi:acyl-CoA synthetase (AMP-forming)/AMP-acid ligase II
VVDLGATTPWRRTAVFPEYRDRPVLEVFRDLAAVCPDRTAVRDGQRALSYRELHEVIDAIAGSMRNERPTGPRGTAVQPWTVTAVVGHGIDALLTVYGVMAAGALSEHLTVRYRLWYQSDRCSDEKEDALRSRSRRPCGRAPMRRGHP